MPGRIHDRYLLNLFARIFVISTLAFIIIYVTIDTFEEIDNYIDNEAELFDVVRYYFYSIPFILTYIIPISLLLGTIFSMGILSRRNELTALIASGVSLLRIAQPVFITAIVMSFFSAWFNDSIVTKATVKSKAVMADIEGKAPSDPALKDNFRFLGEGGFVYLARRYNHRTKSLQGVVVQRFQHNTLSRRVDAKRATWQGERWVFYDGFDRRFEGKEEHVTIFNDLVIEGLIEEPDDFAKKEIDPEDMNYRELSGYIDKVRRSGGKVERYLTDLYFKFSYPLAGAIFVLIGVAFSSGKRKRSIATGFGLTLLLAFIYYGVLRVGQTLGYNGVVPPILAAELGNVLFLGFGAVFLVRSNR